MKTSKDIIIQIELIDILSEIDKNNYFNKFLKYKKLTKYIKNYYLTYCNKNQIKNNFLYKKFKIRNNIYLFCGLISLTNKIPYVFFYRLTNNDIMEDWTKIYAGEQFSIFLNELKNEKIKEINF